MEGGSDVLQGHYIRGRAVSYDAFITLHSPRRNWYLYHNITTKLLWKKYNISTKIIPFAAPSPFLINHHNILNGRGGTIRHYLLRPWNCCAMRNRRSRWRRGSLARRRVRMASSARIARRCGQVWQQGKQARQDTRGGGEADIT
jgi:hypothetical protein